MCQLWSQTFTALQVKTFVHSARSQRGLQDSRSLHTTASLSHRMRTDGFECNRALALSRVLQKWRQPSHFTCGTMRSTVGQCSDSSLNTSPFWTKCAMSAGFGVPASASKRICTHRLPWCTSTLQRVPGRMPSIFQYAGAISIAFVACLTQMQSRSCERTAESVVRGSSGLAPAGSQQMKLCTACTQPSGLMLLPHTSSCTWQRPWAWCR